MLPSSRVGDPTSTESFPSPVCSVVVAPVEVMVKVSLPEPSVTFSCSTPA